MVGAQAGENRTGKETQLKVEVGGVSRACVMKEGHEISTRRGDRRATIERSRKEAGQGGSRAGAVVKARAEAEAIAGSGRTERNRIGRDGTGRDSINLVVAGRHLKRWNGTGRYWKGKDLSCHDSTRQDWIAHVGQDRTGQDRTGQD